MDEVELQANDKEISGFVNKIGKEIKIENERDGTIVTQLIEYINQLQKDKTNLANVTTNLTDETLKLRQQETAKEEEIAKLKSENEMRSQALQEQKQDFIESLENGNIGKLEMLDDKQLSGIKDSIEAETLNQYKTAIATHTKELSAIESELNTAKNDLNTFSKELRDRASLEKELTKLREEMSQINEINMESTQSYELRIKDQNKLIAQQLTMMQQMEEDINKLENVIAELDGKLHEENNTKEQLLQDLQIKETQLAQNKQRRQQSTTLLINKFSSLKTPRGQNHNVKQLSFGQTDYSNDEFDTKIDGLSLPISESADTVQINLNADSIVSNSAAPNNSTSGIDGNSVSYKRTVSWDPAAALRKKNVGFKSIDMDTFKFDLVESPRSLFGSPSPNPPGFSYQYNDDMESKLQKEENSKMTEQVAQLTVLNTSMKKQLQNIQTDIMKKDNEIKQLKNTNDQLHDEIDELNDTIDKLNGNNKTKYGNNGENDERTTLLANSVGDISNAGCVAFGYKMW